MIMKNKITFTNLVGKQFCMLSDEPNKFMIDSIEKNAISKIEFDKTYNLLSEEAAWLFSNYSKLTDVNIDKLNTSNVTDMSYMFFECKKLASLDLSNFDTSKVKRMDLMFDNCCDLTSLNLSNFDTSKVTDMSWMFYKCMSLASLDISSFNFTSTVATDNMFCLCKSLTDLKFGKNLKKPLNFSSCPLTHESALSVINGLAKVEQRQTIFFSEPTYDTLSKEDIKLAEDKKWSIEQY